MLSLDDVRDAAARLDGVAHRTPVLRSRTLDGLAGAEVHLKAECFQRGGAFKFRGAYSLISTLDAAQRAAGVVAFSSGNHAQAVALASQLLGVRAAIVMPQDAPALKLAATRGYGAEVVLYDRYADDRAAIARDLAAERGAVLVPPFDHPLVMAGQGTAALELLDEAGAAGCAARARRRRRPGRRLRHRRRGARPGHPGDRRRARGGRRHAPFAGGGPPGRDPRAAHDCRRPADHVARRADLPHRPAAGVRRRAGLGRRAAGRHAVRLRPPEDRARAERRLRAGRAAGRTGRSRRPLRRDPVGGNVGLERFAELYRS